MEPFNGLEMNLGNLSRLSGAGTRSISAENPERGEGARARWPSPSPTARRASWAGAGSAAPTSASSSRARRTRWPRSTAPGAIQSMWLGGNVSRDFILRIYWDGQEAALGRVPALRFLRHALDRYDEQRHAGPLVPVNSLPVSVNPNRGLNCFWEMPFRGHCRITIENLHPTTEPRPASTRSTTR